MTDPDTSPPASPAPVEAAGAIVWRRGEAGSVQVLLVHRPTYDDWAFPKGKLEPGELAHAAAVREVREETGLGVRLGPTLPTARYPLADGRPKVVRYWSAVPLEATVERPNATPDPTACFVPTSEVDQCAWLELREAELSLTYPNDRQLLRHLSPVPTRTLIVLRHAQAVSRDAWQHDDLDRPLADVGHAQATRLAPVLEAYGVTSVISSPAKRCIDTVAPYATSRGLPIETDSALTETSPQQAIETAITRLKNTREPTVVCTHRPTLSTIFATLGVDAIRLEPAAAAVIHLPTSSDPGEPGPWCAPFSIDHVSIP
ncbi:MAG TPA: NUDIX hydrolase [Actinopolymorphaceae bacterium]|jgi:8-oxo-dGTP diphosphatase